MNLKRRKYNWWNEKQIKGLSNRQPWKANEGSGRKAQRKSLNIEIKSKNRKYERKVEIE